MAAKASGDQGTSIDKSTLEPDVLDYVEMLEKANSELTEALEEAVDALEQDPDDKKDKKDEDGDDVKKAEPPANLEEFFKANPALRDQFEKLEKSAKDANTRAEEAEKIAKAERHTRETAEMTALAKSLIHVNDDTDKFVADLMTMKATLPAEVFDRQVTMMAKANTEIASGNLFSEIGVDGLEATLSKSVEVMVDAIRKADPSMTKEQAIAKVFRENPDLYDKTLEG